MKISILRLFGKIWTNIYKNKSTYLAVATVLQLTLLAGVWLISNIFRLALNFAGEDNLDKNNIYHIISNPISFILLIVLILTAAFFMFIEFSTLTFTIYGQLVESTYSIRNIASNAWKKMKNLIGIQIIFFIGYFILSIPVANIGIKSILSQYFYIPKFITDELSKSNSGSLILSVVVVVATYIYIRLIFTLPLTAIGDKKILDSIKESWRLTKKGKLKFFITIGIFELIYATISLFTLSLTTSFLAFIDPKGNNFIIETLFFTILSATVFFFGALSKVTSITAIITVLIEENQISKELIINKKEDKKKSRVLLFLSTLLVLGIIVFNGFTLYSNGVNNNIKTIAHRGYVEKGVENSIEALEAAAEAGVDYVEMDVLMTKDNKFIVMHDYNLKRLAGINKKVQDMTYNELVGLPISQSGHKSKIPSFEEYVKRAKELNIKLVVELKPHGGEPNNYVDIFIEKVKELDIENNYKYMSLDLKVMEELESKAPQLETGYIIPFQFGKFSNNNVDFFAIEDFSFSNTLVEQAKSQNKSVYVWTINDPSLITKYLQSPANGIITDEPVQVRETKEKLEKNNSYFDRVLRLIKSDK
jgi:glycerophosphodiester phosphodiesterase